MSEVDRWLEGLGLGQYAALFAANDIDREVLPDLTEQDLERLGVSLGHRKRLLRAIAALGVELGAIRTVSTSGPADAPPKAERRQLTVLFCDLVDSTALAARLDPEDLRDVLHAYQGCVADAIRRFDGYVAKYLGDGVLAYFGYPRAHEDDAERAVRSALDLVEVVGGLRSPAGPALRIRVGIATGLVVVGDLIGEGAAREEAVVGETPNLAARLQALAEPNTVVVAPSTRRLLGGVFELGDLGVRPLKGFGGPVRVWRVLGVGAAAGRFEARHPAALTPLVGREEELALLLQRWEQAKAGEGQATLLSGEAGIGKSRLVLALRGRLGAEPHLPVSYQCSPYHTGSALHPVIEQIERAAGFRRDDTGEAKLARLEALLARSAGDVAGTLPLFASLLSIPTEGRYPPLDPSPQHRKTQTFRALLAHLEGLAARQRVLMIVEDAHWIDPTTSELLELLAERIRRLPVLLIVTFRPEFAPPWAGRRHVTSLSLNRLGGRQVAAMIERVAGGKSLPADVSDQIVAKADGVPLFVEELTKTVLESGLLRQEDDRYALAGPLPALAVPATLQDSLIARLDRLVAPAKEVAQTAACIGREFSHELLAAIVSIDEVWLEEALAQLVRAELMFRQTRPPRATYAFKHALVGDAAYETLLKSERQRLHARIARTLEERFSELSDTQPELVAYHCTQAGLAEKAVGYWQKAGQRAIERSAGTEAVAHFDRALKLLAALPEGSERDRQELRLRAGLGAQLAVTRGYAASAVQDAFGRAWELCRGLEDAAESFPVLFGLWRYYLARGQLLTSRKVADRCLASAERAGDPSLLIEARHALAWSLFALGEPRPARAHLEQALASYLPTEHSSLAFVYGTDPGAHSLSLLSWALWVLGYPAQALQKNREALALAQELTHPVTRAVCHLYAAVTRQFRREIGEAQSEAEAAITICQERGVGYYLAMATTVRGWALAARGQGEEALAEMGRGLAAVDATGAEVARPYWIGLLAEAWGRTGRPAEGLRWLEEALATAARNRDRWYEAELHRLRGELLLAGDGSAAEAEACFRRAIQAARRQGARSLELRAATSLARLWHGQDRRAEARDLLAPVHGWFTEGLDTPDLREAKLLLDELGSPQNLPRIVR